MTLSRRVTLSIIRAVGLVCCAATCVLSIIGNWLPGYFVGAALALVLTGLWMLNERVRGE